MSLTKLLLSIALLVLSISPPLQSEDLNGDNFISYLVPINVADPAPGAHGTTWVTELWFRNGSEVPVRLWECFLIGPPCGTQIYEPGLTQKVDADLLEESRRQPLHFRVSNPFLETDYAFSSRLFELSKSAQPAGIHIPVVREDDFFTKPERFLAVPGGPAFRVAVRFYDLSGRSAEAARIEVFDLDGRKFGEHIAPAAARPSMKLVEIHDLGSVIAGLPERFDIRVSPGPADLVYWALVSVTDNETQQVLLITAD